MQGVAAATVLRYNAAPAGQGSPVCLWHYPEGWPSRLLDTQLLQEILGPSDNLGTYRELQSVPGAWQEPQPYLVWKLLQVEEIQSRPVDL